MIENGFKKHLAREHVTFVNLYRKLVGTAPQIKFVSPAQVCGTTPDGRLYNGVYWN